MTYQELDKIIYDAFAAHPLVNSVLRNSNAINGVSTKYMCAAYDLLQVTEDEYSMTYQFNAYLADRMHDENSVPHFSQMIETFRQVLDDMECDSITVNYTRNYQCNSIKYADVLDVCQLTFNVTVDKDFDCE